MVTRVRLAAAAMAAVAAWAFGACGEAVDHGDGPPTPRGSTPVPRSPDAPSSIAPVDSTTLRRLGFEHGPVDSFVVPVTAVVAVRVDQPNAVTVVLTRPPAEEVYGFYARELASAGFRILQASPDTTTLTFIGNGWRGSVTGDAGYSAVALRPV